MVLHQKGWSIPLGVQLPKMGVVFTETGCARTGYLYVSPAPIWMLLFKNYYIRAGLLCKLEGDIDAPARVHMSSNPLLKRHSGKG